MRALSLTQPWATLVAIGAKQIETRSWKTDVRGRIAIHAARNLPPAAVEAACGDRFINVLKPAGYLSLDQLPTGKILATADLYDCISTERLGRGEGPEISANEVAFGDFRPHRFGWLLRDVRPLVEPIPCRGALGLWTVPENLDIWTRAE